MPYKSKQEKRKDIVLGLLVVLLAISVMLPKIQLTTTTLTPAPLILENTATLSGEANVVAVRMRDELVLGGFIARVGVEIRSGEGRISVAFPPFPADVSLMKSFSVARFVAERESGVSFGAVDVLIYFENISEMDTVEGPSASATITILMMAVVENKTLDNRYIVSAEVGADGRLKPVGLVGEKWAVVNQAGYTLVVASDQAEELQNTIKVSNIRELANLVLVGGGNYV